MTKIENCNITVLRHFLTIEARERSERMTTE